MQAFKLNAQGMAAYFLGQLNKRGLPVTQESRQMILDIAQETYNLGMYMAATVGSQGARILHAMGANAQQTAGGIPMQVQAAGQPPPAQQGPPPPLQGQHPGAHPAQPVHQPVAQAQNAQHGPPQPAAHQPNTGLIAHKPAVVPVEAPVFDPSADAAAGPTADAPPSMTEAPTPMIPTPEVQF